MLLLIPNLKLGILQSTLQHRRMTPAEGPRPEGPEKDGVGNHVEVPHVRV
jgi:hypothetical protein